jgi:hypothetical protein
MPKIEGQTIQWPKEKKRKKDKGKSMVETTKVQSSTI